MDPAHLYFNKITHPLGFGQIWSPHPLIIPSPTPMSNDFWAVPHYMNDPITLCR